MFQPFTDQRVEIYARSAEYPPKVSSHPLACISYEEHLENCSRAGLLVDSITLIEPRE